MAYDLDTYNAKNRLRRFSHRVRLAKSIAAAKPLFGKHDSSALDYGCGDGKFLNEIQSQSGSRLRLLGFEPFTESIGENNVRIENIFRSVMGKPAERHFKWPDYLEHAGFRHKELEQRLRKRFLIDRKWYSPTGTPFSNLNSQVFYRLIPAKQPSGSRKKD